MRSVTLKIKHLKYQDASERKCINVFKKDLYKTLSLKSVKIYTEHIFLLVSKYSFVT